MNNISNKNQSMIKGIGIFIALIVVFTACFFASENLGDRSKDKEKVSQQQEETEEEKNPLLEEGQVLNEEEMKAVTEITYDEFKTKLKAKKTSVIMLGYDECYWCQQQKPILESLMYEKGLDVYYLNVHKLEEDQYTDLTELHEELQKLGTPTFIAVKSKKVVNVASGAKTKTQLITMLQDMDVLESE